ncbi:MAG: M23 family metallopeptidase [Myxococcota bacterium]
MVRWIAVLWVAVRWVAVLGAAVGCVVEPGDGPGRRLARDHADADADADGLSRFGFPVAERTRISTRIGVDHDRADHGAEGLAGTVDCTDYQGRPFPHCYDEHHGTDFILAGGFPSMDAGSPEVHAAFGGVVVEAIDGNYDRCHDSFDGVTCDGFPIEANAVVVEHPDGLRSMYWHLQNGSVAVAVGDEVACGDVLGRIGSSGNSSFPHLHFQVEGADGWIDPYAGPFSQPESLWADQGEDAALPEAGCTGG